MLLTTCSLKRTSKLCDNVTKFPQIMETENIELDSLEEYNTKDVRDCFEKTNCTLIAFFFCLDFGI